ncbi:MAG: TolB family protein, partial [bacterium]
MSKLPMPTPPWATDGKQIVFVSTGDENGANEIWRVAVSDTKPGKVVGELKGGYHTTPRWSPDGKWLVFGFEVGSQREIHAVSLLTNKRFEFLSGRHNYVSPVISQDMKSLYFLSDAGGVADIWKVGISFSSEKLEIISDPQALTVGIGMRRFSLTADTRILVYSMGGVATSVGYKYKGGGVGATLLMQIDPDQVFGFSTAKRFDFDGQSDPEFSPDGKWIAFESERSGKNEIWRTTIDGNELVQVTDDERT